jgi:rhodanese-related sulfurtransferase
MLSFNASAEEKEVKHDSTPLNEIHKQVDENKAKLIDCRELKEWEAGHIRDAMSLPLSKVEEEGWKAPTELPKDKPLYIHCAVGARAITVAKILIAQGYDARPITANVAALVKDGGFKEALKSQ